MNITELFQYGECVTFQKGDKLARSVAGEVNGDIYILSLGVCAPSSISCDNKEITHLYFRKQQFVGFTPSMTVFNFNYYGKKTFSIVAKALCVAYRIPNKNFQDLLGFPSVATLMVNTLTENPVYLMEYFRSSKNEPALVQFSCFLFDQAEKDTPDTLALDTVFTYQEVACYLGVHAVTIARMAKALRDEQLIGEIGHQIRIISPEQMVRLITEERKIDY